MIISDDLSYDDKWSFLKLDVMNIWEKCQSRSYEILDKAKQNHPYIIMWFYTQNANKEFIEVCHNKDTHNFIEYWEECLDLWSPPSSRLTVSL